MLPELSTEENSDKIVWIKKDFKIKFIVNISFFNCVKIGISQLPDLVTRGQFYKTLIYCDSKVIPSFCVIKQYYAGYYCGLEKNHSSTIKQYPLLPELPELSAEENNDKIVWIKKDFKIEFIVNISFFNYFKIRISQLPDLVTRGQFYKTLIYCDSKVIPSFCVIKQYYAGNYCGIEKNHSSTIKKYPLLP